MCEWQCRGHQRAAAGRTLDVEPPSQRNRPVADPHQPVTSRIGTSDAVVANLDSQRPVRHSRPYLGARGIRVLDDVRQRLGHNEVRTRLDPRREPPGRDIDLNR